MYIHPNLHDERYMSNSYRLKGTHTVHAYTYIHIRTYSATASRGLTPCMHMHRHACIYTGMHMHVYACICGISACAHAVHWHGHPPAHMHPCSALALGYVGTHRSLTDGAARVWGARVVQAALHAVHAYICTCIHMYMHAYVHACMCTGCASRRLCLHATFATPSPHFVSSTRRSGPMIVSPTNSAHDSVTAGAVGRWPTLTRSRVAR